MKRIPVSYTHLDGNLVVHKAENVQVQIHVTLNLDDIFFAHLIAGSIFNNGHLTVQLVQFQIFVNIHALSGADMVLSLIHI